MKPASRNRFLASMTPALRVPAVAFVICATGLSSVSGESLTFSGTGTVRMLATDWAAYIGGSGNFNAGVSDGGRLYWRGSAGDGQYLHFNLSRLSGLTVSSPATVTLPKTNATWGGGVNGSFIATANGSWTAADNAGIPGASPIGDATNPTGSFGSGTSVSWSIGSTTFQGLVDNASSFNGLAIIGGSGSQLHFDGPMDPYIEVATNATMNGVVTVSDGAAWNASSYSFTNGVLTLNDSVAGGTSGAGNVTVNALGTVFVNGNSGDNRYWAIDSNTINAGGVLVIQGHSHIHNVTLAGGELGGIRPSGTWGGWSFDDATTVTGATTSTLSAQQMNLDNGNFAVDTGSTLDVTGSVRSGSIIKNGGGTMILRGRNTSGGGVTINGGTLIATKSAQDDGVHTLGSGPLTINNGGTLRSTRNWTTGSEWNPASVGSVTINQGGTWSIEGVGQTINNGLYINGGTITATVTHGDWGALHLKSDVTAGGSAVSSISADVAVNSTRTFTVESGSQLNYSGAILNQYGTTGAIIKSGAGTLALSGSNLYTGATTVTDGTLSLGNGTSNTSLANGSNVELGPDAMLHLNFSGSDEVGAFIIDGVDQGSGTFNASTHPGVITGSGALVVQANDGTWISTSDGNWGTQSNWDGNTVASGVDRTATFPVASNVNVNLESGRKIGNLSFSNASHTISGSVKLTLATTVGTPAVTVGAGVSATLSAPLEAASGLEKLGAGTLALSGSADKTIGGVNVATGSMELNVAASLGGLTIQNGAQFVVNGAWNLGSSGLITIENGGLLTATYVANGIYSGLVLNGGTLAGGATNSDWGVYTLGSDVTADGNAVSTISAEIGLAGSARTFMVNAGSTLNVTGVVHNSWQHGPVGSGNFGTPSVLNKSGEGIMTLTASNGYTGPTNVLEGTLSLGNGNTNSNLADTADVSVETGATLLLNFPGTDTIDELWLGGVAMSPGTYTSSHPSGLITGSGALVVTNGPISDPFLAWIDATWPSLSDKTPTGDPDNDGIANIVEYVLQGGDPSVSNTTILPILDGSGANFVFSFTRRAASTADTTQTFQYGSNLAGWTTVNLSNGTNNGATVTITPSGSNDVVSISVPKGVNTSLFGRFVVTK